MLDLNKTKIYEVWHDYVKPKYRKNIKLCYMDTDSFIVHVKRDETYKHIVESAKKALTLQLLKRWIRWKSHERICWINSKNM